MPSIDVAMTRSVRGGVIGILGRSMQKAFAERGMAERSITDELSSVTTAFSSWDNCMAATFCKWPVIAVIIIGGLIILSVVYCFARCLCCGLSCCCECCQCLKCCGNCCGCCDPPKNGRRKYLDEPYKNLPADAGYQREDPMNALPFHRPTPAKAEPPQYASFDVSKKDEGEDSLPAMPTWGDSESKKIGMEAEAVELQQLKPEAPLMSGMSPAATPGAGTPVQGVSPYGPPGSQAASSGYLGAGGAAAPGAGPYNNMPGQGYDQVHNAYGQSTTSFGTEQSWGVTGGPVGQGYGQSYPQQAGHGQNAYTQEPGDMQYGDQQSVFNEYGSAGAANQGYGRPPPARSMTGGSNPSMMPARSMTGGSNPPMMPVRSLTGGSNPGGYPDRSRGSPAPQQGQFASDRNFDSRIAPTRTYSPAPQQPPQQQGLGQFPGAPPRTFSPAPQQQRSFSPAPGPGGPQRTYSPAPGGPPGRGPPQRGWSGDNAGPQRNFSPAPRSSPAPPQRQWSQDTASGGRGPPPPRGPPPRQYTSDSVQQPPQRQFSNSPRPMTANNRPPPQRQYTANDIPPGPRSPNFSRPTRSNTFDDGGSTFDGSGAGGGQDQSAAYPGYKPYQPGR